MSKALLASERILDAAEEVRSDGFSPAWIIFKLHVRLKRRFVSSWDDCQGAKHCLNGNTNPSIPYVLKTTIDISEQALKDAMRCAKVKTKRGTILTALEDFNRCQRMAELVAFSGTCKDLISFNELMDLRERDLPKSAWLSSR